MEAHEGGHPPWRPHPLLPEDPEFYRRVLDHLPAPVVVLDDQACVLYANESALALAGLTLDECVGTNAFQWAHPDDQPWVAEVFAEDIVGADDSYHRLDGARWGSVEFRMVTADGSIVPIELTGNAGLTDPVVRGIAYDLRPAWASTLLSRILAGVARGDDETALLGLVVDLVAHPPLAVDVALLDTSTREAHRVVASSSERLTGALTGTRDPLPWSKPAPEPVRALVAEIDHSPAAVLADLGYEECWHLAVDGATDGDYRLVAATAYARRYENSLRQRLIRARDLTSVVLLRARNDRLLVHAASHDRLTGLANREGLYTRLAEVAVSDARVGLLYLDLDGFKPVNDSLGHAAGDTVLRLVSERLNASVRPTDLVARVGGDEFAVLLAGAVDDALVESVVRRVDAALAEPVAVAGTQVTVSASVGAVLAEAGVDPDDLVGAADAAMYEVKRGARHRGGVGHLPAR